MTRATSVVAAALVLTSVLPASLAAHGEGVLTADRGTAAAGEALKLTGAGFEPGESYQLKLVGALQEFVLATVRVSADSTFAVDAPIPAEAREGSYRLQVVADDGDVSAALDITLFAAAPVPNQATTEHDMASMTAPMGRADEIVIQREQGGAAWAIIGALIGLSAGLGIGLLSRRRLGTPAL